MEPQYSRLVDPTEYETQGLCDGIPLRMHRQSQNEDIGATRCQRDWNRFVEPLEFYRGGLDSKWNFMSVSVPECLPERLEIISYANEFAFLYDGMYAKAPKLEIFAEKYLDKTEDCDQKQVWLQVLW